MENKQNVLVYGLEKRELEAVRGYFEGRARVMDAGDYFGDILEVPAEIIILNPDRLTENHFRQMNVRFGMEEDPQIIFSRRPVFPVTQRVVSYSYRVEDDLAYLSELNPLAVEVERALADACMRTEEEPESMRAGVSELLRNLWNLIRNQGNDPAGRRTGYRPESLSGFTVEVRV